MGTEIDALPNDQAIGFADAQIRRTGAATIKTTDGSGGDATHEMRTLDVKIGSNIYQRLNAGDRTVQFDNAVRIMWFSGSPIGSGSQDVQVGRAAAGLVYLSNPNGGGGGIEFPEMTAPSAGASDTARLFCRDNGSGKSQLCVIFATGAIQVVATEP